MTGRAVRALAATVLLAASVTGCTSAGGTAIPAASVPVVPATGTPSGPGVTDADWPTNHHDNARSGVAPGFPAVSKLAVAWQVDLDGSVYGQPLVVGDRVFAATEN